MMSCALAALKRMLTVNDLFSVDSEQIVKEKDNGEVYERQKPVKLYSS
jgi:hypothetical protein